MIKKIYSSMDLQPIPLVPECSGTGFEEIIIHLFSVCQRFLSLQENNS
jgi:hypothetical protein